MPFPITCPACKTQSPCPDQFEGRKVKCKKCAQAFVAKKAVDDEADIIDDAEVFDDAEVVDEPKPKPKAAPPKPKAKAPPRRDDEDDDDAPPPKAKSKRPRDDDEDDDAEEDEAPRKSKKKKKVAAKGVPPMAYVFMGLFGVLLLGGGSALAYWAATHEKTSTTLAANNNNTPPPGAPKGVVGPPGQGGQAANPLAGWIDFRDAEQRFSIKFPQQPRERVQKQTTPDGQMIDVKMFMVEIPPEVFIANGTDTPVPAGTDPEFVLDTTAQAVGLQLAAKGAIRAQRKITYQGFSGREMEITVNQAVGVVMIARIIFANGRIYTVLSGGLGVTPDSPRVKGFLESLKIE